MDTKGFTLIEIIVAVLILAVIAAIAIPKFIDLQEDARMAVENTTIAAVASGLGTYHSESAAIGREPKYPATLDTASNDPASAQNPFFAAVLAAPGLTESTWTKETDTIYKAPSGDFCYYEPDTGYFGKDKNVGAAPVTYDPAYSADPYPEYTGGSELGWVPTDDGDIHTFWANIPLDFTFDFAAPGDYTVDLTAMNYGLLPLDYGPQFNLVVALDGVVVSPGGFGIEASDQVAKTGSLDIHIGSAGPHTLSVTWTNDHYDPNDTPPRDANIEFQAITIRPQ